MAGAPLFDQRPPFDRVRLAARLAGLARANVLVGTSSWKYPGWLGQVYTREPYLARGVFSQKRFEAGCLAEYALTFPVVCGDFTFYQFPSEPYWRRLFSPVPGLKFAFKVPQQITAKAFPSSYLDTAMLDDLFLGPLDAWRPQVAALIVEFGTFSHASYAGLRDFLRDLDRFLAALPRRFRYAVEIRNPEFFEPDYFRCLRAHGVAHVFNAWTRSPSLADQLRLPDPFTADFTVCRALLRRGRPYEQAVALFSPYEDLKDPNPEGRQGIRELIDAARRNERAAFLFVNNRFEGNAPLTIEAIVGDDVN